MASKTPGLATPPVVSASTSPRVRSGLANANSRQQKPPIDWATKKARSMPKWSSKAVRSEAKCSRSGEP